MGGNGTQKVSDYFYENYEKRFFCCRALPKPFDDGGRQRLFKRLTELGRFTGMHWLLSSEPDPVTMPEWVNRIGVEDILWSEEYLLLDDALKSGHLKMKLAVQHDEIKQIAKDTIGQRDNSLWSLARKHRFTASNFGALISGAKNGR